MAVKHVTCPTCNTTLDLSGLAEIPPQVRCGQCGNVFDTAPASPTASPEPSPERTRWRGDDSSENQPSPTAANEGVGDILPSHLRPASQSPAASQPERPQPGDVVSDSPAADPDFATPKPSSGGFQLNISKDDDPISKRARRRGINGAWVLAFSVFLLVASVGTLGVLYLLGIVDFKANLGSSSDVVVIDSDDSNSDDESKPITWVDASKFSARMAGVKVKIQRVEMGEVRARDENRLIQRSQDESFLQVFLIVQNQRRLDVKYTSWYGNQFTVRDKKVIAKMSANETPFTMLLFSDAYDINGHTPIGDLEQSEELNDTIVFEIPEDVRIGDVENLRLELPGAAFGETGTIHFEIPVSMIKTPDDRGTLLEESQLLDGGAPAMKSNDDEEK